IRESEVIAAVVTRRTLEADSVCRDEIVYAIQQGKRVVPIRIDPTIRLSLLLVRRQWIDFSSSYDDGLQRLGWDLSKNARAAFDPVESRVDGIAPLDFSIDIARLSSSFVGRAWLAGEIETWISEDPRKTMLVVGEPGIGKSALCAHLAVSRTDACAVHFC